jgi:hypothetical protein
VPINILEQDFIAENTAPISHHNIKDIKKTLNVKVSIVVRVGSSIGNQRSITHQAANIITLSAINCFFLSDTTFFMGFGFRIIRK